MEKIKKYSLTDDGVKALYQIFDMINKIESKLEKLDYHRLIQAEENVAISKLINELEKKVNEKKG